MCQVTSVRCGAMLYPVLLLQTHLSRAGAGGCAKLLFNHESLIMTLIMKLWQYV